MDTTERSLQMRLASHLSWANTNDRTKRTAPGRRAADDRFAKQVDPNNELPAEVRALRADSARRAFFAAIALKSHQSRKAKKKVAAPQGTTNGK